MIYTIIGTHSKRLQWPYSKSDVPLGGNCLRWHAFDELVAVGCENPGDAIQFAAVLA